MSPNDNTQTYADELARKVGLSPDEIYVSAPKEPWMLRNQLWQGAPTSTRFPLGVVFVTDPAKAGTAVSNAKDRMETGANGFDAVAICAKNAEGKWVPVKLLERVGGTVGWKLKVLSPALELVHVSPQNTLLDRPTLGPSTEKVVADVVRLVKSRPNVVLQGPPGTGKTYLAMRVAESLAGNADLASLQLSTNLKSTSGDLEGLLRERWFLDLPLVWELVQMHPGYSYDDFVRGRTLVSDGAGSRFESVDRIVPQLARVAHARGDKPTLLIVDEINRCNLGNVLGELIFALDPESRGESIRLQYPPPPGAKSGEGVLVSLPKSLLVLATMNTADRSIALVDFAIRRRFRFVDVPPAPEVIEEYYSEDKRAGAKANAAFDATAELVAEERLRIGHSYFLVPLGDGWASRLANRIAYEVIPLLREYSAEGHLRGVPELKLPDGTVVDVAGAGADLGDTRVRDQIKEFLSK